MALTNSFPAITHDDVRRFADAKVNLPRDDANEYRAQVRRLRDKLEKHIIDNPSVGLKKMMLSGSLAKGLALRMLNDIDVAVYVDIQLAPGTETELLHWLAERLRKAYPQMDPSQISPGDHAVRISFKGTGLDVDVVPIYYEGDPNWKGYLYSRATGQRVLTSIPMHLAFTQKRKNRQMTDFAQVVRLVKWWAKVQESRLGDPFKCKSFMAELVTAHLADSGQDLSDYPRALEAIFGYMTTSGLKRRISFTDYYSLSDVDVSAADPISIIDPVNPKNNVAATYTDGMRRVITSAAEESLDSLSWARHAPTKGDAVDAWQQVLGPSFRGDL